MVAAVLGGYAHWTNARYARYVATDKTASLVQPTNTPVACSWSSGIPGQKTWGLSTAEHSAKAMMQVCILSTRAFRAD